MFNSIQAFFGVAMLFAIGHDSAVGQSSAFYPSKGWAKPDRENLTRVLPLLKQARDYALTGDGSGMVIHGGAKLMEWGDVRRKYDLKSTSKSIGFTAMGLAIMDGKVSLEDQATKFHPNFGAPPDENARTGWLDEITFFHLATQTAGFAKRGGYEPLLFRPGTHWHYSDGGPNWIAECLTHIYQRDLEDLLRERVFQPIGIASEDLHWRNHAYRPRLMNGVPRREFGSGVHANVDAMARIGYLYLNRGRWEGRRLLPESFARLVGKTPAPLKGLPEHDPDSSHGNASDHYGLLWWNNNDGELRDVPRDAFWSWGLYDSLIFVVPSLDLVVSRAGQSWSREGLNAHYDVVRPFYEPLVKTALRLRE